MSDVRTLADKLKAAPSVSDASNRSVLLRGANGSLESISAGYFPQTVKVRFHANEVLRISNIESVFIACCGRTAAKAALIWVSSYGAGTSVRTRVVKFYLNPTYEFYYNGPSEDACVYVRLNSENNDSVAVTSLFGETPIIEKVSALPSDTTPMTFS